MQSPYAFYITFGYFIEVYWTVHNVTSHRSGRDWILLFFFFYFLLFFILSPLSELCAFLEFASEKVNRNFKERKARSRCFLTNAKKKWEKETYLPNKL